MKKWIVLVVAVTALISSCGGGGGGSESNWNSGSENNPTASMVDASGNTVAKLAPNAAMIGRTVGFLQNGTYNVSVIRPDGTSLYGSNLLVVTDGSGALADSILAYPGVDTQNQAAMVIDVDKDGFKTTRKNFKAVEGGAYTLHFCKSTQTTCDATTASTTSTINVDTSMPYVFSADSTGAGVNSFKNGVGDVYAVITNGKPSTTYGLRIVSNSFQIYSESSPLPTDPSGPVEVCITDAAGACAATLLWTDAAATLAGSAALYDIIADEGNNGTWEAATDFMDAVGYVPGFAIQEPSSAPSTNIAAVTISGLDRVAEIACSASGSGYCAFIDIFSNEDVYGYLNPAFQSLDPHDIAYKYIILHSDTLANGDTLTPIQSFGYNHTVDPMQWGCTNEGRILLWPKATFVPGCYDVVMDVNQNGIYDSGTDFVDGSSGVCGFIIPGAEGAPTVTIDTITDGNGTVVASGGSTSSSTATFTFTTALGTGTSISTCEIRWAAGNSSNRAAIDVSTLSVGGTLTTQPLNLFNGINTILITCIDNGNKAGVGTATIDSTNTATQNIHFQTSLVWQQPASGSFDMDLHVVEPGGTYFTDTDCYYANCRQDGTYTTTTGEFLNVDCISQCTGPENIWMPDTNALKAGNYRVCVDPFSGKGEMLQVSLYDSAGSLIDTITRGFLDDTVGDWYVGNFNCSAGTGGTCVWSRVDTLSMSSPCQ